MKIKIDGVAEIRRQSDGSSQLVRDEIVELSPGDVVASDGPSAIELTDDCRHG